MFFFQLYLLIYHHNLLNDCIQHNLLSIVVMKNYPTGDTLKPSKLNKDVKMLTKL